MCNIIGQFRGLHGLLKSKVCLIWFLPLYLNPENKYCTNLVFLVTTVSYRTLFFYPSHLWSACFAFGPLKSLTSNLNFLSRYLDGHLSVQEDNICATKDGMEKKNVGQKVLGMQKYKRICY